MIGPCWMCFTDAAVTEGRCDECGARRGHAVYRDPVCLCGFRLVGGETRCRACGTTNTKEAAA